MARRLHEPPTMKLNNSRGRGVGMVMRLVLISLTLAMGAVLALPTADCRCGPACDGRSHPAPAEKRSCCDDEVPTQPRPCACFHRAAPDPATLEMNAPAAVLPATAEAPPPDFDNQVKYEVLPPSNAWRADQARGSPLFLLHSVLLI